MGGDLLPGSLYRRTEIAPVLCEASGKVDASKADNLSNGLSFLNRSNR